MMSGYRKFSRPVQVAIIRRAIGADGKVKCERCGVWVKTRRDFEIDHVLAERMRPDADKRRRLVAADGQLLCAACHEEKTRDDVGYIAEAKRREAKHLPTPPGKTEIQRRYGL